MNPTLEIDPDLTSQVCQPVLIWAEQIDPPFAERPMPDFLAVAVARAAELGEDAWEPGVKKQVRDMLRHGKYKPSGRSKPASEFLLKAAGQGDFPQVCSVVDVNNAVSLESGLPGTIFDSALSGDALLLRRGMEGENYVFNPSGQTIDLRDLLLVCRRQADGWQPCGNPVKDAMLTKVMPETRSVIAVLYGPAGMDPVKVESWGERFSDLLRSSCGAARIGMRMVR